jgi:Mg-chelatase subunit ChlD
MPAPQILAFLPKPILFGLYGAIGGLLGALVFGEPAWQILRPPPPKAATKPEPQLAISTSKELQLLLGGENPFAVEIDRVGFDGPVDVKVEKLPSGVKNSALNIARGESTGKVTLKCSGSADPITTQVVVTASATVDGKLITASTSLNLQVIASPPPEADVVFVVDVTGSMDFAIHGIRDGISGFAAQMRANKIDFRIGLVAFRDLTNPDDETVRGLKLMQVLQFEEGPFTTDVNAFKSQVGGLVANGGGDIPESSLEAVATACDLKFRKGATKVLLLITDAPPKVKPEQNMFQSFAEELAGAKKTAVIVRDREIDIVDLVVRPQHERIFAPLMEAGLMKGGGQSFDLQDTSNRGAAGFTSLLDKFTSGVVEAAAAKNPVKPTIAAQAGKPTLGVKGVQSSQEFDKESQGELVLAIGVWTGAISALVCLVLLAGQHHYLRGSFPDVGGALAGVIGGLIVGIVGGAAGQGLYLLAPDIAILAAIFRVFGWSILGGLAGVGLSLFIPNLRWFYGLAGGGIGGAVGAVGYMAINVVAGDLVGRLVGGLILGFCIGMMVAIVEAAFRRAWLEVRYGARETITVNLGPEPVKIGGDNRACTVWARGAAPVAIRYFIRKGQVVCEDTPSREELVVRNGDSREVGNVTVTVRTGSSVAPDKTKVGVPRPTKAPPLPRATPVATSTAPKPLGLDPFDDPLPVPIPPAPVSASVIPPKPAPVTPAAAPPRPPVPTAGSKPPAPAPPRPVSSSSAVKQSPGPRDPDACPSCGRKNPGRPGARYCVLCDQTY